MSEPEPQKPDTMSEPQKPDTMSEPVDLCKKIGFCSVTYLPNIKNIVYTESLFKSGLVSGFPVEIPMSKSQTRKLYFRDDPSDTPVNYITPSSYKYKPINVTEEDETGVTFHEITPGSKEIHATYDEFRALDLYVMYQDNGKYKDILPPTPYRNGNLIKEVKDNKVSYSKYLKYLDNKNNFIDETDEIRNTQAKIKNMTKLLKEVPRPITTSSIGGKVKSRRKIKSKKNSKSHKGKSRKGKSHKGNSKKTRRKSNRRSR